MNQVAFQTRLSLPLILLVAVVTTWLSPANPALAESRDNSVTNGDGDERKSGRAPRYDKLVESSIISGDLVVTVHKDTKREDLDQALKSLNYESKILDEIAASRMYLLSVPAEKVHECRLRLGIHPYVESCGFNEIRELKRTFNDPALAEESENGWNLHKINAPDAWDVTVGGATIAIVDSGIKKDHEEFDGKLTSSYSVYTRSGNMQTGLVKVLKDGVLSDQYITNHGTHVAATAAGLADNELGTAGVAPGSAVMPVQVLSYYANSKSIMGYDWALIKGLNRAMDQGAKVINYSIGTRPPAGHVKAWKEATGATTKEAVEGQILNWVRRSLNDDYRGVLDRARRESVIVTKSAGNDDLPARFDPLSSSRRVISVAATTKTDARASFSNYGGYTTVSAPGQDVWNAYANSKSAYGTMSGTSMAAPHAAGVVALMKTIDPQLSRKEAAEILIATGKKLTTDKPIGPLVNAAAAVNEVKRRRENNVPRPELDPPLIGERPNPCNPVLSRDGVRIFQGPRPWRNPDVRRIIDLWLAISTPIVVDRGGNTGPFFWDRYGRVVRIEIIYTILPPDYADDRYQWLWDNARRLNSSDFGTLYVFVIDMMKSGKFNPLPTPSDKVADKPTEKTKDELAEANGIHPVTTAFAGLATSFTWNQVKGANTALVTFTMNGAEGNVLKQFGLPATVTVTAKRAGGQFVVPAGNPMSAALTAAGANASRTAGGTPAKISATFTFMPSGKKVAIQSNLSVGG